MPASSQALWVSLSQSRGVPIRTGTSLSWGFHLSWDDAKALLHTRCTCDLAPWSYPSPLSLPHLRESANCGQTGPCVCISCRRTIHFRPHCGRWNCGAHQAYAPTPDHTICLCPDCAHSWMHLAASSLVRVLRPAVPRELWLHVSSLANCAQVGAGHNVAQQTGLSCRRIKRWLLRYLLGKELFSAPLRTLLMNPPLN